MIRRRQIEDFFSREIKFTGIERELRVRPIQNKIISLVGPRRAGKTWYFYSLYKQLEKPMYVNLEDIAFRDISPEEFFDVIKIFSEIKYEPKTILLDEIQTMNKWEVLLRSLQDRGFRLFITGSSSKLLSKEISTQLRGRSLTYLLLPFSFREFLKAKDFDIKLTFEKIGTTLKSLKEYLEFGGFPEVALSEEKQRILREYFDEIFYKDFVERHTIKSLDFGRFLFEFCFQNFSREIGLRKIKSFFKKQISYTTLYEYVDKLQDTITVFFLDKFSSKIYLRRSWPKKIYVCDFGISSIFQFHEKIGDKMENCVFLELKRKQNENPLMDIYYFKDYQHEVDFVIKEGLKVKQLMQVTYASGRDEIEKREIKALIKASDQLKCKSLEIITWDYEDELKIGSKTIRCLPLWKWLTSG